MRCRPFFYNSDAFMMSLDNHAVTLNNHLDIKNLKQCWEGMKSSPKIAMGLARPLVKFWCSVQVNGLETKL